MPQLAALALKPRHSQRWGFPVLRRPGGRQRDPPQINSRPCVALLSKLPQYWPERRGEYVERDSKPVSGELCELCQLMIREGDCAPLTRVVEGVVRRVDG